MKNETHTLPKGKIVKGYPASDKPTFPKQSSADNTASGSKKITASPKRITGHYLTMPQMPQGYLRGHENDCL